MNAKYYNALLYIRKDLVFIEGFVNALPLDNAARVLSKIDSIRLNLKAVEKEVEEKQLDEFADASFKDSLTANENS